MTTTPRPLPMTSRPVAPEPAGRSRSEPGGATVTRLVAGPPERFAVQGTLALDLRGTGPGLPETPELEVGRRSRVEHVSDAEVRAWAARLAQAVVETVSGRRPVTQLVRWTTPEVYRDVDRRARTVRRAVGSPVGGRVGGSVASSAPASVEDRGRPQVRSVHVCRPSSLVAEVSVHVRHAQRSRAVAMRLERRADRWLCTVLEFG